MRALVVDDDRDHGESVAEVLEMRGFSVDVAFTGEDAVSCFRDVDFDIVLMDVKLPGMSGVEAFSACRMIRPAARVVMMTGYSVEQLVVWAVENGALGVLHATTAAYPGLSARLQVHGDRGSAVIDNDVLTFFHRTPTEGSAQDRAYGSANTSENQVAEFPEAAGTVTETAGSNPGQLPADAHRRQYENFLAALAGTEPLRVDLETNRRSIAVITAVYESARTGRPVRL